MPYFSIILVTYNRAELLQKCLDALGYQSYKDFEIIICDDGSTDNTTEIAENYQNKFSDFQYIRIPNSGWPSKPRNTAMNVARGQWYCFLDSDDLWHCDKLKILHNYISKYSSVDVIYHDASIVDKSGNQIYRFKGLKHNGTDVFSRLLYHGNKIPFSGSAIRVEKAKQIGGFEEDVSYYIAEDYDFWLKAALAKFNFGYIPKVLSQHLQHDGNLSKGEVYDINCLRVPDKYSQYLSKRHLTQYFLYRKYKVGVIKYRRLKFEEAKIEFKSLLLCFNPVLQTKSLIRLLSIFFAKKV